MGNHLPCHDLTDVLMLIGSFKWKVRHYNQTVLNIEGLPYCTKHECSFVSRQSHWVCPIIDCNSGVSKYDLDKVKVAASSIIKSLIEQKKN